MNYPELEIGLQQRNSDHYSVQMRLRQPGEEAEQRAEAYPVQININELRELQSNPDNYGRKLGEALFSQAEVRSCFDKAKTAAQTSEQRLRLRLCIDRWSVDLHSLRWETLRDPESDRSILMDDNILFSRFLGSFDMRPVRLRAQSALRALVAVANPSDLAKWKPGGQALAPIDVAGEMQQAKDGLGSMPIHEIGQQQAATMDAIINALRDDYDVFYLVCHGAFIDGEARLWLQADDGTTKVVSGNDLVDGLARLNRLPRLVVLASCQSSGDGGENQSTDQGALAALGPRLAEAGIPAVIAMQGNVLQKTIRKFIPVFFSELQKDGQIDRAMSEARFAVREMPDHWSPVLYTRLISGRLWYQQRFAKKDDFDIWDGLIDQLHEGSLIPVIGPGLLEPYMGSQREIAKSWAHKRNYPMASSDSYSFHQIAQYVSTTQGKSFATNDISRHLLEQLQRIWPEVEPNGASESSPNKQLLHLLSEARKHWVSKNPNEPHDTLAKLNCPLYLTTNHDDLLIEALEAAGKKPRIERPHWRMSGKEMEDEDLPMPTGDEPLCVQLLGHLEEKRSMVLTEDDYFEYLIATTRQQSRPEPSVIQEKLTDSGLMFLGFRMDDWQFRIFLHMLNSLQGSKLRGFYKNVAVQIDPEEGLGMDLARARHYLEKYFGTPGMQIEIYWGSTEEFLNELNQKWEDAL